ncbi:hypothetical protein COO60DRAFT_235033 [Scenedesmus sp. NREL 46B-D3]|nr:hypothetical protein COO60DRAFT_235033 [Scenedesmus sp. NREL 46B-D3]
MLCPTLSMWSVVAVVVATYWRCWLCTGVSHSDGRWLILSSLGQHQTTSMAQLALFIVAFFGRCIHVRVLHACNACRLGAVQVPSYWHKSLLDSLAG